MILLSHCCHHITVLRIIFFFFHFRHRKYRIKSGNCFGQNTPTLSQIAIFILRLLLHGQLSQKQANKLVKMSHRKWHGRCSFIYFFFIECENVQQIDITCGLIKYPFARQIQWSYLRSKLNFIAEVREMLLTNDFEFISFHFVSISCKTRFETEICRIERRKKMYLLWHLYSHLYCGVHCLRSNNRSLTAKWQIENEHHHFTRPQWQSIQNIVININSPAKLPYRPFQNNHTLSVSQ